MSTRPNTLVAAAAVVVSGAVLAQPALDSIDPEEQLRQQIADLQTETGLARPAGLIDPLRALAMLQEEAGNHTLASATLEEARYVVRIHNGLASADEALLLRQQIRNEKELGNDQRVWDLEQDMVTMARQHHDDIRMLPIFRELADDRLGVVEQVRDGKRPPIIFIGCYYGAPAPRYDDTRGERRPPASPWGERGAGGPSCMGGSMNGILGRLKGEILMYYADAIEVILRSGDYASQELRQLEKAALRVAGRAGGSVQPGQSAEGAAPWLGVSFAPCRAGTLDAYLALEILSSCLAPVGRGDGWVMANVGNRAGLIRLISYEIRSAAPAAARANAVAELADAFVLAVPADRRHFETSAAVALALYDRAYGEVQRSGDLRASTQMFAPELPVTLPADEANPFAAAATESSRYIDVTFVVTRYGIGEHIEILETSRNATRAEKRDLVRLIESTTFRPRFVDGELADSAPVVVRYPLGP